MLDLVIRHVLIYDGSGEPAYSGNVGILDGKISYVGIEDPGASASTIDGNGLALAPGFIDSHSHSDTCLYADPHRLHVLRMGVTTEIAGQCGGSRSPAMDSMSVQTREFLNSKHSPFFATMAQQLREMETWELGPNQLFFTGHNLLRAGAMQLDDRKATDGEIAVMQEALRQAIAEGSAGISTGLSYVPGIYSDTHELTELGRTAGQCGGMYVTHSRSESMGLFDSVGECIHISKEGPMLITEIAVLMSSSFEARLLFC